MYTINLSSLESPDPRFSQDDEYSQDFNTEIDYEDEILTDYVLPATWQAGFRDWR